MTEEIIIDVNECPHKSDDDCMEVPVCNEYGDLMGYQSCEAQTLCPYRSRKKIERLEQENKELKKEKSKLLDKSIEKQCRINDLLKKCSIKEFSLIVNGKKYSGLNGIDKAKLFINNENAVRDKYIKKLESEIFDTQWKFADAHKEIYKYRSALEDIRELVRADCKGCTAECDCDEDCTRYVIKNKINEVLNEGK